MAEHDEDDYGGGAVLDTVEDGLLLTLKELLADVESILAANSAQLATPLQYMTT